MKHLFILLVAIVLVTAYPKPSKYGYKNLYAESKIKLDKAINPKIIGGQEAVPHSIPYQVFLTIHGADGGWYCGGSLITESTVLTAGIAAMGKTGLVADIVLGAHKPLQSEDTQIRIESQDIVVHPGFDINVYDLDVGVIRLPSPVILNDNIQIVTLADDPSITYEGADATVSGWGLTDGFGDHLSDVLMVLNTTIISNDECYSYFDAIKESNICITGDNNTGSCNGDSGGPMTVDGVQVGIVSFGVDFCLPGYPSAFTRVTSYLDFINENKI